MGALVETIDGQPFVVVYTTIDGDPNAAFGFVPQADDVLETRNGWLWLIRNGKRITLSAEKSDSDILWDALFPLIERAAQDAAR